MRDDEYADYNGLCTSVEFSRWQDLSVNNAPAKCVAAWLTERIQGRHAQSGHALFDNDHLTDMYCTSLAVSPFSLFLPISLFSSNEARQEVLLNDTDRRQKTNDLKGYVNRREAGPQVVRSTTLV